ncbi:MAG: hypothetical protein ACR2G0_11915 [Chthoniobacterales bacterium]
MRSACLQNQTNFWFHQNAMNSDVNVLEKNRDAGSATASIEIHSYLAARDRLLREAEGTPTNSNLRRALAANEFAENCLRSSRSPYQAQSLPEAEAAQERLRCHAIKVRLSELRRRSSVRRHAA